MFIACRLIPFMPRRTTHCSRPSPASLSSSSWLAAARLSVARWLRAAEFGRYVAFLRYIAGVGVHCRRYFSASPTPHAQSATLPAAR